MRRADFLPMLLVGAALLPRSSRWCAVYIAAAKCSRSASSTRAGKQPRRLKAFITRGDAQGGYTVRPASGGRLLTNLKNHPLRAVLTQEMHIRRLPLIRGSTQILQQVAWLGRGDVKQASRSPGFDGSFGLFAAEPTRNGGRTLDCGDQLLFGQPRGLRGQANPGDRRHSRRMVYGRCSSGDRDCNWDRVASLAPAVGRRSPIKMRLTKSSPLLSG